MKATPAIVAIAGVAFVAKFSFGLGIGEAEMVAIFSTLVFLRKRQMF
ncbi:MAG TPA: hypothetical protein VN048_17450 [Verrucomicrobiae bacterium]|jgi:hypothetical protein|nr:hypothetical protein [Verrucomicrobiae bacterium]